MGCAGRYGGRRRVTLSQVKRLLRIKRGAQALPGNGSLDRVVSCHVAAADRGVRLPGHGGPRPGAQRRRARRGRPRAARAHPASVPVQGHATPRRRRARERSARTRRRLLARQAAGEHSPCRRARGRRRPGHRASVRLRVDHLSRRPALPAASPVDGPPGAAAASGPKRPRSTRSMPRTRRRAEAPVTPIHELIDGSCAGEGSSAPPGYSDALAFTQAWLALSRSRLLRGAP